MNEKLNVQNLIELLAEKHGMDKKDAESFVKEFFQLVEESLESDKYVKIKGLGTFKLIDVERRESVNINTGERFEIQGHTKVSFTPEPSLKDLINKPFSHFETVVLNDETVLEDTPIENNSEEEDEKEEDVLVGQIAENVIDTPEETAETREEPVATEELIAEEAEEPIEEVLDEIEEESVEVVEETEAPVEKVLIEAEEEPVEGVEETLQTVEEHVEEFVDEQVELETQEEEQAAVLAEPVADAESVATVKPVVEPPVQQKEEDRVPTYEVPTSADISSASVDKQDSSTMKYFIGIVVLVVVLCVGAVIFMYYPDLFDRSMPPTEKTADEKTEKPAAPVALTDSIVRKDTTLVAKKDTVAEVVEPKVVAAEPIMASSPVATTPEPVAKKETPAIAPGKETKKSAAALFEPDSLNYKIVGTKTTYTIQEGETLTRVALRFYGTKALWPYIVKYNADVIKNPDHVPYGTVVKIPELVKK